MSLRERLFGGKGRPPALDLSEVQAQFAATVARQAGRPVDAALVCARLADGCRDAQLQPPAPEEVEPMVTRLDEEGWRRLAVLASALDLAGVRSALAALATVRPLGELLEVSFPGLARSTPLLTLELLRQSPLRVEELARKFLARLGADIRGESAKESLQRRERLDYGRLLEEAERAKKAAEARAARLRQLQDEQEQNRPRRGKW